MTAKLKKIYFTRDFSAENVAKLKADGWLIRAVITGDKSIEAADSYGGEVPAHYKVYLERIKPKVDQGSKLAELASENSRLKEELAKQNGDLLKQLEVAIKERDAALKDVEDQRQIIEALKAKPVEPNNSNDKTGKTK